MCVVLYILWDNWGCTWTVGCVNLYILVKRFEFYVCLGDIGFLGVGVGMGMIRVPHQVVGSYVIEQALSSTPCCITASTIWLQKRMQQNTELTSVGSSIASKCPVVY